MRRVILTLCLLLVAFVTRASKAITTPFEVLQPDGTTLTLQLYGDEHFSWITTLDGALVVETAKGYCIAQVSKAGELESTLQLAHNSNRRTRAEKRLINHQNKKLFFKTVNNKLKARRTLEIGSTNPPYFPHMGSPKVLTILVEFSDSPFYMSNPKKSFNQYLNKEGKLERYDTYEDRNYGSVRQYFKDMSGGKFAPSFDVMGPIKLSKPLSYYGSDSGETKDVNIKEMIKEACKAVDDSVNFKDYDNNGDDIVDLVYIIFAGYSQSVGNQSIDIWPKSSWIGTGLTLDGVSIRRYGVSNELNYTRNLVNSSGDHIKAINGIGLFCHEFSHTMGLPDFYSYKKLAQIDNQAMEYWDLMDGGEYTDAGYTPTPYTPWEKEVMGWSSVKTLADDSVKVTLQANEATKVLSNDSREYLMLHNLPNSGWYQTLYNKIGHGMLVYRINYEKDKVNMSDHVNDTPGKPGMTIVPADGLLVTSYNKKYTPKQYKAQHAGDPFPGTSNVDSLTSVTMNYGILKKPIYNIQEDTNGSISFNYLKKDVSSTNIGNAVTPSLKGKENDNKIYTTDGKFVGDRRKGLPRGVYIQNKKKFMKPF